MGLKISCRSVYKHMLRHSDMGEGGGNFVSYKKKPNKTKVGHQRGGGVPPRWSGTKLWEEMLDNSPNGRRCFGLPVLRTPSPKRYISY